MNSAGCDNYWHLAGKNKKIQVDGDRFGFCGDDLVKTVKRF